MMERIVEFAGTTGLLVAFVFAGAMMVVAYWLSRHVARGKVTASHPHRTRSIRPHTSRPNSAHPTPLNYYARRPPITAASTMYCSLHSDWPCATGAKHATTSRWAIRSSHSKAMGARPTPI